VVGGTSIVTAAGTTTLDVNSYYIQLFTGTTTQTVVLPVASTLQAGWSAIINNQSTGVVTVQTSGGNTIQAMVGVPSSTYNSVLTLTCINPSGGTGTASWIWEYRATGIFTLTGTGFTTTPTSAGAFELFNKVVTLRIGGLTATSNAVGFGMSGVPAIIAPNTGQYVSVALLTDNSVFCYTGILAQIYSNIITFFKNGIAGGFTAAGTKGLPYTISIVYNID
jgi:hypothetical protein